MFTLPRVLIVFGATTLSLTGLLAAWVALGRGHWFARTVGLAAWIGAWLLVPAYEIVVILVVQSLVVVPPLALARQFRNREPDGPLVQFALRDLFLLTVVVAAVVAAGAAAPASVWIEWDDLVAVYGAPQNVPPWVVYSAIGVAAGLVAVLATWVVLGRCRLWKRLATSVLVGLALGARGAFLIFWQQPRVLGGTVLVVGPPVPWWSVGPSVLLGLAAIVAVWWTLFALLRRVRAAGVPAAIRESRGRLRGRAARFAMVGSLVLLSLALLVPPAAVWYAIVAPPPIPEETLPEPNGYDVILRVGGVLENVTIPDDDESLPADQRDGPGAFRAFRGQYGAFLGEARAALDLDCRVPLTYDASDNVLERCQRLRQLARSLAAASKAAGLDGDHAAAAEYALDTVRLGRVSTRGGLLVDWLVGIAVEGIGLHSLHTQRDSLPEPVRRDVIRRLREMPDRREPLDDVARRDRIWENHVYGWQGRLIRAINRWNGEEIPWRHAAEDEPRQVDSLRQIVLAELALAGYRDDQGQYPPTLAALVPEYLDEVPRDPFGEGPLRYRPTEQGYDLYSVGPNGVDDGRRSYLANDPEGDDVWF